MNWMDEERPNARSAAQFPASLESLQAMSLDSLADYITQLQGEIARVGVIREAKTAARGAAEGFFKKPVA